MGRVAKRPKAAAKSDQKKDPSSKRREAAEEKSERDVTTGVANVVEKMDDEDDDDAASSKSRKAVHFKALDKGITKKKTATRRKKDAAGLSTFAKIKSKLSEANATATTKQKYEAIKTTFLKQIKATNDVSAQVADQANKAANNASSSNSNDLNFVRKDLSSTRLTNTLIKSLLASQATTAAATPVASNAAKITDKNAKLPPPPIDNLRKVSQLSKKTKAKLKKHVWQERIGSIRSQLMESVDKARREKTAIVGDMDPLKHSLMSIGSSQGSEATLAEQLGALIRSKTNKTTKTVAAPKSTSAVSNSNPQQQQQQQQLQSTRKERHEKKLHNELAKSIPKQSIRLKQTQEDCSLFTQLVGFSQFAQNPLETLKKHLQS